MKYIDINRADLIKWMPATIAWLEALDSRLSDDEIILRDTDHVYNSLRFERKDYSNRNSDSILSEIDSYISTHCCLCGSTDNVKTIDNDNAMLHTFCGKCLAVKEGVYSKIKYQISHKNNVFFNFNPKVRIKFKNGNISYARINDLTIDGNSTIRKKSNNEELYIVGIDLALRDKNDERVFDGDIVICESKDGQRFGGMILEYTSEHLFGSRSLFVYNNGHSLPAPFSYVHRFEVIGTIAQNADFCGMGPREEDFDEWRSINKDRFDKYF